MKDKPYEELRLDEPTDEDISESLKELEEMNESGDYGVPIEVLYRLFITL